MNPYRMILSKISKIFQKKEMLPTNISVAEAIDRYIFSKSHFGRNPLIVKYGAFMPAKDMETSVFRTNNLTEDDVWSIGIDHVEKKRKIKNPKANLKGKANTSANLILQANVDLESEASSHYRHANIIGWPEALEQQQMIATEIAASATIKRLP